MNVSVRSYLLTGLAAVVAAAIAIAPSVAPPPGDVAVPSTGPTSTQVLSKATVELLAAVQQMTPRVATAAPAAVTADPVPLNAASDFIITAWNAVLPWIDYGVDLTDYVLGFIPFGYAIGDQISIVYYSLVRPVANSFVVDLVAPVVNDPLNINSYVSGLITLGSVTVTSLINLGINEFNYFFGWLIPPIPPLPLAAPTATTELTAASLAAAAPTAPTDSAPAQEKHTLAQPEALTEPIETDNPGENVNAEATIDEEASAKKPKESDDEATPTANATTTSTSSSGTVEAQGEVRESGVSNENGTDATTASPKDKGDQPGTANGATQTTGASAATNDDTGAKRDKKDDTGKK